ncbi:hypothetical protein F3Y22_tig00110328pilonHSYRG00276 [Hibiscus syriacus]|uniref:Uncharacterized protein n=1 Tax=Hibiscus syriacus TaxID=106335 RepID=A0A6A3B323_HIBSY|nr:hypothetical protein F3Y22_tig00110328pilonHSYRG00276 [Hibiscus syriacus]
MIWLIKEVAFCGKGEKLKTLKPKMLIEALVPDFRGDAGCVEKVTKSGLDVFLTILRLLKTSKGYFNNVRMWRNA